MKKLWLHTVRSYLRLGMFFYFKRLEVHGIENVPKNEPVLLLANHQNALLDALLIACKCGRFSYFLTRAAVFKKSFVSTLLKSLQMLPIYRIRDGWSTIANNNAIFETCSELLSKNEVVVIFPEGSHSLVRRVRPLSKGFTRIVFSTLEKHPELDLKLVPVGLNFVNVTKYPDSTAIYFGKPINAKDFVSEKKSESVINLKQRIHTELTNLTTHIPEENYEQQLQQLLERNIDLLNPSKTNNCLKTNFKNCSKEPKKNLNGLRKFLNWVLILNMILPYLVWKFLIKPKIKEPEFISTFRFAVALTLVPFYLIIIAFIIGAIFGITMGLIYIIISLLLSIIVIKT